MLSETTCPDAIGKSRLTRQGWEFAGKRLLVLFVVLFLCFFLPQLSLRKWERRGKVLE